MQVPVQIAVEGKSVMGILHIPEKRAKGSPVIIVCNGLNGNRVEFHRMLVYAGRKAEESGVVMLRFDCRGLGVSEGEFWQTSMKSKLKDILSMIEFVYGCFHNEQHTLILLGYSDGAKIASAAAQISKRTFGLAAWSPVLIPLESGSKSMNRFVREPLTNEIVSPFGGVWIGKECLREMMQEGEYYKEFFAFPGPKLCIFGTDDDKTKGIKEKMVLDDIENNNEVKIVHIPDAGHVYQKQEWSRKIIDETINWAIRVGVMHDDLLQNTWHV